MNIKLMLMKNRLDNLQKRDPVRNANIIRKLQRNIAKMENNA